MRRAVVVVRHAHFAKSVADRDDRVLVAHPHRLLAPAGPRTAACRRSTSSRAGPYSLRQCSTRAAVALRDFLVAEAEAEDGHVEVEDAGVEAALVSGGQRRAAGQDDAFDAGEGVDRILGLADLGEHALAADLGRNEVRVLTTEINDGYTVMHRQLGNSQRRKRRERRRHDENDENEQLYNKQSNRLSVFRR